MFSYLLEIRVNFVALERETNAEMSKIFINDLYEEENVLFFMISDGAPNESVETVRQAVLDVEKQGFAIVAVSIEPQYDPSLMYHRNVNLTDMSRLAVDLGKMVKKAIADNTNRKIQ